MKLKTLFAAAVTLTALFAASSLHAASTNLVTISTTAEVQAGTNTLAGVSTISSPGKYSVNTKQVLSWLAQDEYAEGNWASNSFPSGAELVVIVTTNSTDFQVLGKNGILLVDVSDLLSTHHGDNSVISGKVIDATDVYDPSVTVLKILRVTYDDSQIVTTGGRTAVGVTFYLQGLESDKITDSKPKSGVYTRSVSASISDAAGDGTYNSEPFVIAGNLDFTSKESLTTPDAN